MDLGIGLPVCGPYAGPEAIGRAAETAERIGLAAVWTYERLLRPAEPMMLGVGTVPLPEFQAAVYDPRETLSYVAARTSRIRLGTSVLNALFHPPIVLARRLSTLDRLSGGRLTVGLGQGWMAQEFTATGVPPVRRGAGFAEHIAAMRRVWGPDPVRFDGRFYRIPEGEAGPKPSRPDGPTLFAGAWAPAAVERAASMGLGLITVFSDWDTLRSTIATFRNAGSLPVAVHVNGAVTTAPVEDRAPLTGPVRQVAGELAELASLGVDHVFWVAPDHDPDHLLDALGRLLRDAGEKYTNDRSLM
ncbi:TIGR03619 family F420-dependent LLM class oxidoreductase [Nonomuraea longicatena]|uniref:LLM class F420-dependent oxidoreductase n=1 Tax=Nonomuraea longicatena TaxID=83682 RepID=A0ABN1NSI3_9ACTN